MKKIALIFLVLIIAAGAISYLQFKPWLEGYLVSILEQQGVQNVKMHIASIGPSGATLEQIQFGQDDELFVIEDVTLKYSLNDLQQQRIDELVFENVSIKAIQGENGWSVYGLDGLKSNSSDTNPLAFISLSSEQVEQIPFKHLAVKNSMLELIATFGSLKIPIHADWQKYENPNLSYRSDSLVFTGQNIEATASNTRMNVDLSEGAWAGNWSVENLKTQNASIPDFSAKGQVSANDKKLVAEGDFSSSDSVYIGDFNFEYIPGAQPLMTFNSSVNVEMPISGGQLKMPAQLNWTPASALKITGDNGSLTWQSGELSMNAQDVSVNLQQEGTAFTGDWRTNNLSVTAPMPVPVLWGHGDVRIEGAKINVSGVITSNDKKWESNFSMQVGSGDKSSNGLRIKSAKMPWENGRITVRDVWIPFEVKQSIKVDMKVERVDLAEVMSTMTADRIKAKGIVSGFATIIIDAEGDINVKEGELAAEGPGTIVMPPETIPANNDQVNLVKDIMQDLHFEVLNLTAIPDENGELTINLSVQGKNPKVYDGHPVKLNINLTGNLLEFIEQNMMIFTKPEQFLKKESK